MKFKQYKIFLLIIIIILAFAVGYSFGYANAIDTMIDMAFKVLNIDASDIVFSDYGKELLKEYIAKGGLS